MNKLVKVTLATGGVVMMTLSEAQAALNAGVATAFTALQTDALALIDLIWPVVTAVTVGFIIIGLFKKGAGKAV
jgi:hypothetical protein